VRALDTTPSTAAECQGLPPGPIHLLDPGRVDPLEDVEQAIQGSFEMGHDMNRELMLVEANIFLELCGEALQDPRVDIAAFPSPFLLLPSPCERLRHRHVSCPIAAGFQPSSRMRKCRVPREDDLSRNQIHQMSLNMHWASGTV
jgi:hypothetical protein